MIIFIISGLSGSGKSIALQAFEDMGYYCVDNLPAVLLSEFVEEMMTSGGGEISRVAVSIDSRNRRFLLSLPQKLKTLENLGLDYRILFLQADDGVLVTRFSETRRRHPMTDADTPLLEGISRERQLLDPLHDNAHRIIDTSRTTPHELTRMVRDIAGGEHASGPILLFESFAYKNGTPMDADFVFDVRCLPNPHWHETLRPLTGLDSAVRQFLQAELMVEEMLQQIKTFIDYWLPKFEAESRSYITVAIGCTGGQHRSVYMVHQLGDYFSAQRENVHTRHRELAGRINQTLATNGKTESI